MNATNQHGVHSPFVYQLVTECFYNRKNRPNYKKISAYRKDLFQQKEQISIRPNCSTFFKAKTYSLSKLAKIHGTSWKRSKFLNRLTDYLNFKDIIEIGTLVGIRTSCFAAQEKCSIITIDNCSETQKVAEKNLQKHNFKNINFINDDFINGFKKCDLEKVDCIYLSNTRRQDLTLQLFEEVLKKVHNNSVIIIEDIHWSKEINAAWEKIKKNKQVKVTVDTFYLGLIFFRKEQAKEHFKIRF
ncbi:O-methyltransferase [Mesonia aquimarina]|uniref:O-methyltransferase n=1 Tax=Mesonia aquimarina TaxID=1504967 RepID=UPI0013CE6B1B|nr:class I SAM-dependent methyltransferase [Mesonia aquimarina]